jgi:hypothetical protein
VDYPSNSQNKKENEKTEPKKIVKVVSGEVIRKKKSLRKRFAETFMGGNFKTATSFVALEVLIPAAKDMIADAFSQGIEKILFSEVRSTNRRSGYRSRSDNYISYNRYSQPSSARGRNDIRDPRSPSRRSRASHDFDEIIIDTRVEATEVIDKLFDLITRYESASVADLYELVGVTGSYTDEKYGWTDLRGADVTRVHQGYLLDLPRPELLD